MISRFPGRMTSVSLALAALIVVPSMQGFAQDQLTIERCVSLAMQASPDAKARAKSLADATAAMQNGKARLAPTVSNSANASYDGSSLGWGASLGLHVPYGQLLGPAAPLANGAGADALSVNDAWAEAKARYDQSAFSIGNAVRAEYLAVMRARYARAAGAWVVERAAKYSLPEVQGRRAQGLASEADLLRAQSALDAARIRLRQLGRAQESAEKALREATGLAEIPADIAAIPADEPAVQALLSKPMAELTPAAQSSSAAVLKSQHAVAEAAAAASLAKLDLLPHVGIGYAYYPANTADVQADLSLGIGNVLRDGAIGAKVSASRPNTVRPSSGWSVGLNFSLPSFGDGGVAKRDAAAAAAGVTAAKEALADTQGDLTETVSAALASLQDAYDMWKLAITNTQLDDLALHDAQVRLSAGLAAPPVLEDAQAAALQGRNDLDTAAGEMMLAASALKALIGSH